MISVNDYLISDPRKCEGLYKFSATSLSLFVSKVYAENTEKTKEREIWLLNLESELK